MPVLTCVFGINIQKLAYKLDKEWCDVHCQLRTMNQYNRHTIPQECYMHLMSMGIDPENKKNTV